MEIKLFTDYLIKLIKCTICDETPENKPENINEEQFFKFCQFHKLENMIFLCIKKHNGLGFSREIFEKFEKSYMAALTIGTAQQFYLDKIEIEFEKSGIDYLILKGRTLSCLYPSSDMRKSSDFDIYVGKEAAIRSKDIMLSIGFNIAEYNEDSIDHDEYTVNWVLCELHKVLIQNNYPWQEECNKITDNLKLCDGTNHCYEMSLEDFLVYNLAHTAKHMKFSGIGIRAFLDMWLIYRHTNGRMNMEYLKHKLESCHLTEFEKNTKELCEYWFEGKEASDKIKEMAEFAAQSGWIGTYEMAKSTELAERAGKGNSRNVVKLKKYMQHIFLSYDALAKRYPVLEKYKWLTPVCAMHRILKAVFLRQNEIKAENTSLNSGDMDEGKRLVEFKHKIGL